MAPRKKAGWPLPTRAIHVLAVIRDAAPKLPLVIAPNKRGRASNRYAVELDGRPGGWLTDLAGAAVGGELGSSVGRY
jgi:hypothetical protein